LIAELILGRKLSVDDPNMGTKTFEYNSFGEVILQEVIQENDDNLYTHYQYDYISRLTQQLSNVDTNGNPIDFATRAYKDNYLYDPTNAKGQLEVSTRDSNQYTSGLVFSGLPEYTKHFGYDEQSRLSVEETDIRNALNTGGSLAAADNENFITKYYYDNTYNRIKQVNYRGGFAVRNYYTKFGALKEQRDGRIEQANQDNGTSNNDLLLNVTSWNLQGAETKRVFNGNINLYSATAYYPSTGQIAEINNSADLSIQRLTYKYDPWGNIYQQGLNLDGTSAVEGFKYDNLHRLIEADVSGASVKTYMYDAIGNIKIKSDFSNNYIYGGANQSNCNSDQKNTSPGPNAVARANALSYDGINNSSDIMTYDYDSKGNRIEDCINGIKKASYSYDYNNLLIQSTSNISGNGQFLEFNYGTDNQRYRKYDLRNDEITLYGNKDYERVINYNEIQNKYYLTSYLTIIKSDSAAKKVRFMQKDRLGSTTQILDESGQVLHNKSYDAFGKPRKGDWSDNDGGLFKARLDFTDANSDIDISKRGFTDHEHLDDMQLIHMNGRMYDYNNGRFLSVDPFIQDPSSTQSMNPYTYIFNNPQSVIYTSVYCAETD
jgi:RHS repeat-associated protein